MRLAHTCKPSYSGGRDQQDPGFKPSQRVHETLFQKYPMHTYTQENNNKKKEMKIPSIKKRAG
jgi:hypothetical protein